MLRIQRSFRTTGALFQRHSQRLFGGVGRSILKFGTGQVFAEGMSAGKGFIAIAALIFGKWHPIGTTFGLLAIWRYRSSPTSHSSSGC
ncbi:MAG: hypothetical protein CLLPBCKN_005833 [Chroococcidiopsis cubana SAG 39.79]|nr:hypothetical protein [Chroococcidiopsis cubana SAG 39.79]